MPPNIQSTLPATGLLQQPQEDNFVIESIHDLEWQRGNSNGNCSNSISISIIIISSGSICTSSNSSSGSNDSIVKLQQGSFLQGFHLPSKSNKLKLKTVHDRRFQMDEQEQIDDTHS